MATTLAPQASVDDLRRQSWIRRRDLLATNGVWVALIGLVLFNVVATRGFVSVQTLQTNLGQMATVGICAVGLTLVMATGGIDLSVGSLMAVAGASAGVLVLAAPAVLDVPVLGLVLVVLTGMAAAAVLGAVNGYLVGHLRIQPIVATLVVMITARGIAQMVTSGRLYTVENDSVVWLGRGSILGLPVMAWVMLVVVVVASWVARRTVLGRRIVAVGGNETAAALAGIPVRRTITTVYVVAAALAGLAALLSVGVNGTVDTANLGLGYEFTVISAVVVGGTALTGGRPRIWGSIAGVALLQLLGFTLASHDVAKEVASLVQAAVIVAAVTTQLRRRR
ncbi:ABC transporter permease [Cellulomonas iranensis]|jgi:ribose/xylose/arabinose/galactoside ABC-type transport system permease subunit|uniref:Ribose/xylose/arabinose/galactoside ABC-type transport system permease subunit n=1 Tax=Cellulomonas iranensis TaxID=76862 RepID=A0ABU0GMS7_9CELL|nr:ABC transporter permease [Cellulomonas iranensis]MDQ0425905.1 ribose/xylose/arabinose/galactoside ABC-type transport system permease subunit [Cellulomonas iranensis]